MKIRERFNCSYSNLNGLWVIKTNPKDSPYLYFNYKGYLSKAVRVDAIENQQVVLESIALNPSENDQHLVPKGPYQPRIFGHGTFQFGVDFNKGNYNGFRPLLGDVTTDFLSNYKPIIFVGLGYEWIHGTLGFNIGYTPSYGDRDLIESVESDNFMLDLNMGYKIIDSRRWKLTPKLGFKFFNYTMTSTVLEDDASLTEYLENREIELNISQPFGYLGLDFEIKFQTDDVLHLNYWSIGCYGNYQFKLKDTPFLSTKRTQLESNIPIDFQRINWGVSARMYFGSRL